MSPRLLLVLLASLSAAPENLNDRRSSIIGGVECPVVEYPFVVTVMSGALCGGTAVSLRWVLTAAHCVDRRKRMRVRAGFTAQKRHVQFRRVERAVVHDKYDPQGLALPRPELRYDIALLLLERPFRRGPYLNLAVLPKPGETDKCTTGKVLGIGLEDWPGKNNDEWSFFSRKLKCVDLPIVDLTTCSLTFPTSTIDNSLICTMAVDNKDSCSGDSGGPLLCNKVLVGIVSTGRGCAIENFSATYTRVEPFLNFIQKTTGRSGEYSDGRSVWNREMSYKVNFWAMSLLVLAWRCHRI